LATAETLFAAYHDRLLRYLSRAAGQTDRGRDLTQEVFLRVSRTAIPVVAEGQLGAWLFRIARNVALDHHRQQQRRPELQAAVEPAKAASQDTTVAINQALSTLPDLDRDVFLMREVGGLGYDDIASACELTPDAVRSRIHRARLQLREMLSASITARQTQPMRQSGKV
jgi:RNA polymerase sigma-70 factor (ECF subfamily)